MAGVQQTLTQLREVEGVTGPLYCLASAKFLAGKLAGLYDSAKHLSDFIQSPWAQRNGSISKIKAAWGHCDSVSVEDFNQRVLKASVAAADAKVKAHHPPTTEPIEFTYFHNTHTADHLLSQQVPIVAGVAWDDTLVRKHFITTSRTATVRFGRLTLGKASPASYRCQINSLLLRRRQCRAAWARLLSPAGPFFLGITGN
jgi:hypothetical protein